jgi:hypothetical protein
MTGTCYHIKANEKRINQYERKGRMNRDPALSSLTDSHLSELRGTMPDYLDVTSGGGGVLRCLSHSMLMFWFPVL